jgi:hypothetical protein
VSVAAEIEAIDQRVSTCVANTLSTISLTVDSSFGRFSARSETAAMSQWLTGDASSRVRRVCCTVFSPACEAEPADTVCSWAGVISATDALADCPLSAVAVSRVVITGIAAT